MMIRKVCALAEITIAQVSPVLTPISATHHFKDFVLLAWFSKKENRRYHICLECRYEEVFGDDDTLVITDEDDVLLHFRHLRLCYRCSVRRFSPYLTYTVTDDYLEVEEKFNVQ